MPPVTPNQGTPRRAREARLSYGDREAIAAFRTAEQQNRAVHNPFARDHDPQIRVQPETPERRTPRGARGPRQSSTDSEAIAAFRTAERQQNLATHNPFSYYLDPEIRTQPEPALVLNRATVLLACICLLRLHMPHWDADNIVGFLRWSFPDILLRAHDVQPLYMASCLNRPRWVNSMCRVQDPYERVIAQDMLEVLQSGILAQLPQLPQENYRDPREAIRYLQDLVGVHGYDRYG